MLLTAPEIPNGENKAPDFFRSPMEKGEVFGGFHDRLSLLQISMPSWRLNQPI